MTIREAVDNYAELPYDTKLELSYFIKNMTDDEFTDSLQAQKQDHKKDIQRGILLQEESVAIQIEALAERISCRLGLDFDAVEELLNRKFEGHTTAEEDVVFEAMCNDFRDLKSLYKKNCER